MGSAPEASTQRIRYHLRRPIPGNGELLTRNARNTIKEIVSIALLALWHDPLCWSGSPILLEPLANRLENLPKLISQYEPSYLDIISELWI